MESGFLSFLNKVLVDKSNGHRLAASVLLASHEDYQVRAAERGIVTTRGPRWRQGVARQGFIA